MSFKFSVPLLGHPRIDDVRKLGFHVLALAFAQRKVVSPQVVDGLFEEGVRKLSFLAGGVDLFVLHSLVVLCTFGEDLLVNRLIADHLIPFLAANLGRDRESLRTDNVTGQKCLFLLARFSRVARFTGVSLLFAGAAGSRLVVPVQSLTGHLDDGIDFVGGVVVFEQFIEKLAARRQFLLALLNSLLPDGLVADKLVTDSSGVAYLLLVAVRGCPAEAGIEVLDLYIGEEASNSATFLVQLLSESLFKRDGLPAVERKLVA